MSAYASPAPHRVFRIPEVLGRILEFSRQPNDLQVCRLWFDVGTRHVWGRVSDIGVLLEVLFPRDQRGRPALRPTEKCWERFELYAGQLRKLVVWPSVMGYATELKMLSRLSPAGELFPRLHALEWRAGGDLPSQEMGAILLRPGMRTFCVEIREDVQPAELKRLCTLIAERMPELTCLELCTWGQHTEAEEARTVRDIMLELLHALPNLHSLLLPYYWAGPDVIGMLARQPKLVRLRCENQYYNIVENGAFNALFSAPNAFEGVEELGATLSCTDFMRLLRNPGFCPRLIRVYLETPCIESGPTMRCFFEEIIHARPDVDHIILTHHRSNGDIVGFTEHDQNQLTFDVIRPILTHVHLRELYLTHIAPFQINLEELTQLAKGLPQLVEFALAFAPVINVASTLDLYALEPFARHCWQLKVLRLYMNAQGTEHHPETPIPPFACLEKLDVGSSSLGTSDTGTPDLGGVLGAARFLYSLLPPKCKVIVQGILGEENDPDQNLLHRKRAWTRTRSLMQMWGEGVVEVGEYPATMSELADNAAEGV